MIFDSTQFLGFIACKNAKTIIRNLNRNIRNHPHSRAVLTGLEHLSHHDSKQSGVIWDGKEGIRATKVLQKHAACFSIDECGLRSFFFVQTLFKQKKQSHCPMTSLITVGWSRLGIDYTRYKFWSFG